jgi:AraC-like DNA-binding protein
MRSREYIHRLERALRDSPQLSISLSHLAYILDLERTYCCRAFKQITGKTFSEWTRSIRIARAKVLLPVTGYTITKVADAVGYNDITTFERNFRKETGISPMTFRQLSRAQSQRTLTTPDTTRQHAQ